MTKLNNIDAREIEDLLLDPSQPTEQEILSGEIYTEQIEDHLQALVEAGWITYQEKNHKLDTLAQEAEIYGDSFYRMVLYNVQRASEVAFLGGDASQVRFFALMA